MPLFSLTVHYPVVDMCSTNGTIRIVPTSNRWSEPIPNLEDEAPWMRGCEITCRKSLRNLICRCLRLRSLLT